MPRGTPATDPETRLGYRFHDPDLLALALTPPSSGHAAHNQRLEFLGDALLNAAVALLVHRELPGWPEGDLSKLRGMLVRREALQEWSADLGLRLRPGPRSPRQAAPAGASKALADAVEAVLGALFLDAQAAGEEAFPALLAAVERRFLAVIQAAAPGDWERQDSKTTLQERTARRGLPPPTYVLLARDGPDHAPRFRIRAEAGGFLAEAEGSTIKAAEVEAARILLAKLGEGVASPLSFQVKLG